MTIREAIDVIGHYDVNFYYISGEHDGEEIPASKRMDAFDMAIRSLEAWETVMDEIREQEYQLFDNNGTWHGGAVRIEDVEKIINKQLSEVSIKEMEKVEDKDV